MLQALLLFALALSPARGDTSIEKTERGDVVVNLAAGADLGFQRKGGDYESIAELPSQVRAARSTADAANMTIDSLATAIQFLALNQQQARTRQARPFYGEQPLTYISFAPRPAVGVAGRVAIGSNPPAKAVVAGSELVFYGYGFEQLTAVVNYADSDLFVCRYQAADGASPDTTTQAFVAEETVGDQTGLTLTVATCGAPDSIDEDRLVVVTLWLGGSQVNYVGSEASARVALLTSLVDTVAPESGQLATGTAAPFVTGFGFDAAKAYSCIWKTPVPSSDSVQSKVDAVFVSSSLLRCSRPDSAFAGVLDAHPAMRAHITVVYTASGVVLKNGDNPNHEFAYSTGACGDGHKNGGELGVDCGRLACGKVCDGTDWAAEGQGCDQNSDCVDGFGCLALDGEDLETCQVVPGFVDCAAAQSNGEPEGMYKIFGMRQGEDFPVYCRDGWALMARVTIADCQAHCNTAEVALAEEGFGPDETKTVKFLDDDINAYKSRSSYNGITSYFMEADNFDQNGCGSLHLYCRSECVFGATTSIGDNAHTFCTDCSSSFEGNNIITGQPNHGTYGLGHHHLNSRTTFAWQRHPESGGNCGFRADDCGYSDGKLWVK